MKKIATLLIIFWAVFGLVSYSLAQTSSKIAPKATFLITPSAGTFLVGSTFDVSIFLNTQGNNINAIEANIKFPPDKMAVIKPSGGKSFITVWTAHPKYSNTEGTANFTGIIPNGIITGSGLVTTMSFKILAPGEVKVEILPTSRVLINDGSGTEAKLNLGEANYTFSPKPPDGIRVSSQTHPFEDQWYNNNSPILAWEKPAGVADFSFILDNKFSTIPDNKPETNDNFTKYENIGDGLWRFHIKARKNGVWGATTHFALQIDTAPPAPFEPKIQFLTAIIVNKALITFLTSDSLSGIDHYEVGVINKEEVSSEAPVFIQTESPYQLNLGNSDKMRVIVRAVDRAGNAQDASLDINNSFSISSIVEEKLNFILAFIIFIFIALLARHQLAKHEVFARLRKALRIYKDSDKSGGEGGGGGSLPVKFNECGYCVISF